MAAPIVIVGTLDTKGEEITFVRDLIEAHGHSTVVVDCGVLRAPSVAVDISAGEVAKAGGGRLEDLRSKADRGVALDTMARGARKAVHALFLKTGIGAVIGLGGSGGTAVATAVMRILPVGIPKVMVSTLASGDVGPYVGTKDITMMFSVVDIAGLNRISRRILTNAVGAVCGMVEQEIPLHDDAPLIAATMFGVTTPCVDRVRALLQAAGYEVLIFHATGSGGRAMEALIEGGLVNAVADITTTEWCDEVVGGVLSAGPRRLEAAGKMGVPQVVSCGALDMVNFWGIETVPEAFQNRLLYAHNANVTLMRTNSEECAQIGRKLAQKLSAASGPVTLLLPLRGISAIDAEGLPFHDPEANAALFRALRHNVAPSVKVVELDLHINDPRFADAIVKHVLEHAPPVAATA